MIKNLQTKAIEDDSCYNTKVIKKLNKFKFVPNVKVTNRTRKIYTRDIFNSDN